MDTWIETRKETPVTLKRLLIGALLLLITGVTTTVVGSSAAFAAATCTWDACDGRDPHATGCDVGAKTLDHFSSPTDSNSYVELRYSPTCQAAWSKLTTGAAGMPAHSYLTLNVYTSSSGGSPTTEYWKKYTDSTNNAPSGQTFWTSMNSYGLWVQACLKNVNDVGPCTARH